MFVVGMEDSCFGVCEHTKKVPVPSHVNAFISESEKMSQAFLAACQHGTHPTYRARLNIIGHSGAGKTSLTRRLLGMEFVDDLESTDGIVTHRIEFSLSQEAETKQEDQKWQEAELKTGQLVNIFNTDVLERTTVKAYDASSLDVDGKMHQAALGDEQVSHDIIEELQNFTKQREAEEHEKEKEETQREKEKEKEEAAQRKKKKTPLQKLKRLLVPRKEAKQNQQSSSDEKETEGYDQENDSVKGVLRLWDFGGQTEFYTTHHMFLDADAVNIIVMDISKALRRKLTSKPEDEVHCVGIPETPEEFLCYWLRSIEAVMDENEIQPTVLLVLTHKDKVVVTEREAYIALFKNDIKEIIHSKKLMPIPDHHIFVVDNKEGPAAEFEQLKKCVKQVIEERQSWGLSRPIRWLKLEADMKQRIDENDQEPVRHLNFQDVQKLAKVYHMADEELKACLHFLHNVGDLIWFSDESLRDVITLDPQWLVDIFKLLITSEQFIKKRGLQDDVFQLLRHGRVSFKSLEKFWVGNDVRFLVEMMRKFDLILPLESKFEEVFLVPSMLPQKQIIPQTSPILKRCKAVYTTEHFAKFEELFAIGTFSKLLAAASKVWPICEEADFSCSFASFSLSEDTKLVLYQPHRSCIKISLWCQPDKLEKHPLSSVLRVTSVMSPILQAHRIPPSELCELICPNWRPDNTLFCTRPALPKSLDPASSFDLIQYVESECLCTSSCGCAADQIPSVDAVLDDEPVAETALLLVQPD